MGNVTEHRYNGYGERTSTLTYAGDVYPIRALALNEAPTGIDASLGLCCGHEPGIASGCGL